ncbi:MAG: MarR family transcriptional regulator [Nitrospirota bacterium]
MKVRNIKIGIATTKEILDRFIENVKIIGDGGTPKKSFGVYFENLEAMRKVLTPNRLAILKVVKEKEPSSLYELAKMLKRDTKNVSDDVALLAQSGFIKLKKTKEDRMRVIPKVDYDKIVFEIAV